jgi:hypothetical protein
MIVKSRAVLRFTLCVLLLTVVSGCGGGGSQNTTPPPPTVTTPTVTLLSVTGVTQTAATSGGNVTSDGNATVTARGVVWSANANPTTADSKTSDGTGTGSFSSSIAGLTRATTYHLRAYATNSSGTGYSSDATFTTLPDLPVVTTTAASGISSIAASAGGNVTDDGGGTLTARGVVWSTAANPTTADSKTSDGTGTGSYASSLTGLAAQTTYHIRAYAINSGGTAYGSDVSFTTLAPAVPTVTLTSASSITKSTASAGGNVTDDGGASVTARGVVWGTSANPTTANSLTSDGTGKGTFTSSLTGLTRVTTYHLRAYATNSVGTGYSADSTFTTLADLPTVITTAASSVARTTATAGGNVTDDGGATITARGLAWSVSANPTTANSIVPDSTGATGSFVSSITGLTASSTYHIRAYATNSIGTAYGSDLSFTTLAPASLPTVTTAALSGISGTTAQGGGSVTSDGGDTITERGLVWGTTNPPTTSDNKVIASGTTGDFTAALSSLTVKTTYYVRAYATNSAGTGYGAVQTLATLNQYGLPASVGPLITNQWLDYTPPYNDYYPSLNGTIGQAACGPTAIAKIFGYWKQTNGNGNIDATDISGYHWVINLNTMNIDYSKVYDVLAADATQAQYDQTAKIFLAAGAVGNLNGIGGINFGDDFFSTVGGYLNMSPAIHAEHDWEYTSDDWLHLVEYELAQGRPLMVAGRGPTDPEPWQTGNVDGHWWTVDGYNAQDQIHATYNFTDYSGSPIAGFFPLSGMGPITFDNGIWAGYTGAHDVAFNFQPLVSAISDPVVETEPANNPTAETVRLQGAIVGEGNASVISRGFHVEVVSGASVQPFDVGVGSGAGHFITTLTGLSPAATYTVKAYGDTTSKRFYGEAQQFTTLASTTVPAEVMPLLPNNWFVNTWPYNAGLPAYASGPGGYFYNEQGATVLARLLHYWRYPANGVGVFDASQNWNGTPLTLKVYLSALNLDYTQMDYAYSSTATAAEYGETAKLIAAAEIYGFGTTGTGNGNLRSSDLDAFVVPNLVAAWKLDSGLQIIKQENVTADQWAQLLKTEIAAGRPVLVQGRTTDSVAPGVSGYVNAGWFLVDGYNAAGQFHADYAGVNLGVPVAKGWYAASALGPAQGYTAYNRALIGFKPAGI